MDNAIITFEKDKTYIAIYVDEKGTKHRITFKPNEDLNIVKLIMFLKENYSDFLKLIGVVIKDEEEIEIEEEFLEEAKEVEDKEISPEEFKDYVIKNLKTTNKYIEDISVDKPNDYDQWGMTIYGYDYDVNNDNVIIDGVVVTLPYKKSKNKLDQYIEYYKRIIDKVYEDATNLFDKEGNIKEEIK